MSLGGRFRARNSSLCVRWSLFTKGKKKPNHHWGCHSLEFNKTIDESPNYLFECPIITVFQLRKWQKILRSNHFHRVFWDLFIQLKWLRLGCALDWMFLNNLRTLLLFLFAFVVFFSFVIDSAFLFTLYVVLCESKKHFSFFLHKTKRWRCNLLHSI